jgi:hypothetical protein
VSRRTWFAQPNFLIGLEAGEKVIPIRRWRSEESRSSLRAVGSYFKCMNDSLPAPEDVLWGLIGARYRFPDPGDEERCEAEARFLDGYPMPSFGGLTWGWLKIYHDMALSLPRFHPGMRDLYRSGQAEAFARRVRAAADHPSCHDGSERWSAPQTRQSTPAKTAGFPKPMTSNGLLNRPTSSSRLLRPTSGA